MCWPEWEVPSEGALFSSGFVVKICDFLHFVYTFKPNYRKLSTDLDHRQKPNHWTLCFFFLPPSHIITCTTDTSTSVCRSSPDLSRATLIFFSQFSFPFGVCQPTCFHASSQCLSIQTFVSLGGTDKSKVIPWAGDWMSVCSGDLTSGKSFKYIGAFLTGSSASDVLVSSPRWTKNGTVASLMLVSSI